jgi:hypothetical protein
MALSLDWDYKDDHFSRGYHCHGKGEPMPKPVKKLKLQPERKPVDPKPAEALPSPETVRTPAGDRF